MASTSATSISRWSAFRLRAVEHDVAERAFTAAGDEVAMGLLRSSPGIMSGALVVASFRL
jgi:hypothetical protein